MRIVVVVVEQIPYRLESRYQTFFDALVQCGRNNRFNCPFGACQIKSVVETVIYQVKSVQTNPHRRQERGAGNSGARLQLNDVHSGA